MIANLLSRLASAGLGNLVLLVLASCTALAVAPWVLATTFEMGGGTRNTLVEVTKVGLNAAVTYAIWFGLMLTRKGRLIVCALSVLAVAFGLLGAAVRVFPSPGLEAMVLAPAVAVFIAQVWLAMYGVDVLERLLHGRHGEERVAASLRDLQTTLGSDARALNDALFPAGNDLTQIDHVLVVPRGVVVIETKANTGLVGFNQESGEWWVEKRNGARRSIADPIAQNAGHLRAIRGVVPDEPVFSLVVMTDAIIDESIPRGVVSLAYLRQGLAEWSVVTEESQVSSVTGVFETLRCANVSNAKTRRLHLERLHQKFGGVHPRAQERAAGLAAVLLFLLPIAWMV